MNKIKKWIDNLKPSDAFFYIAVILFIAKLIRPSYNPFGEVGYGLFILISWGFKKIGH